MTKNNTYRKLESANASALQRRWRFCQEFARFLYRSDLSFSDLRTVAESTMQIVRAREDADPEDVGDVNGEERIIE